MNVGVLLLFVLAGLTRHTASVRIGSIKDAIFVPLFTSNFTVVQSRSKNECLCLAVPHYTVMNYFDNGTCQLFATIPCSYRLQSQTQARLYVLNESVSLTSGESCTENLTRLIDKLNNTVATNISVSAPRCLVIDDHGYLATVLHSSSFLNRYDPINLTLIDQTSLNVLYPLTITFHNGAYYIGSDHDNLTIFNSTNFTMFTRITSSYLSGSRDIIFINNGYTMIVASYKNDRLVFFNRSNTSSMNYTYAYYISLSYSQPHGLWRVNDSFFYVTSYANNTISSYSAINSTSWIETRVVDARSIVPIGGGTHVIVDRDGRLWFSLENGSALIYNQQGVFLGAFHYSSVSIYDLLITENYVIYVSSDQLNQLLRLDPQIDN